MRLRSYLRTGDGSRRRKREPVSLPPPEPRPRAKKKPSKEELETKDKAEPDSESKKSRRPRKRRRVECTETSPGVQTRAAARAGQTALTACQTTALERVAASAAAASAEALPALRERARQLGVDSKRLDARLIEIRDRVRLLVHVQLADVLDKLLRDTHYRSQFETQTSNGLLSPTWRCDWERALFGDAYDRAAPAERVKYGVLDLLADADGCGGALAYGRSYLVLRGDRVRWRTTLTPCDSSSRSPVGTLQHCAHLLQWHSDERLASLLQAPGSHAFYGYFECQFHGDLLLARDVAALVVSPEEIRPGDDGQPSPVPDLARRFARQNRCRLIFR